MTPAERRFLEAQRVARLATADAAGAPHVVPVCFALVGESAYVVLDAKPKTVAPRALKRARNVVENPRAALVADRYDDRDWSRLGWVMLRGPAELLEAGPERDRAVEALRARYAQYRAMELDGRPAIALRAERVASWGDLSPG